MSRSGIRRIAAAALTLVGLATLLSVGDAAAAKKKKKTKAATSTPAAAKINTKALGDLMGPYKFGMTQKDILGILSKQIADKYKDKIAGTSDVYVQDKMRANRQAELDRIKNSYIEFKGQKSGWDVSIIDDQFAHNTGESMMVYWENQAGSDQRRFFFFHEARLYKMFVALNSSNLKDEQRNFAFFKGLMEARYGKGTVRMEKDIDGVAKPIAIEWRSSTHHVLALDKLSFYGAFCLMVADSGEEKVLVGMRESQGGKKKEPDAVMKAVMKDGSADDTPGLDDNKAAVDAVLRGK